MASSAKRDFPKEFGLYRSPKRQKVYVNHEFSNGVYDESEEISTDTGTFDSAYDLLSNDSVSSSQSFKRTETIMDDEDKDCSELVSTDHNKVSPYVKRSVSAVRCYPPGCGRNAVPSLSDEELEKELKESKNHWLTCKSCRIDVDDDQERCADKDNADLISVSNLQDNDIDSEPSGIQRSTNENPIGRMTNEHTEPIRSRRPRVRTVRYIPPGCVVAPLTEEELKLATKVLQKHRSTCK